MPEIIIYFYYKYSYRREIIFSKKFCVLTKIFKRLDLHFLIEE